MMEFTESDLRLNRSEVYALQEMFAAGGNLQSTIQHWQALALKGERREDDLRALTSAVRTIIRANG